MYIDRESQPGDPDPWRSSGIQVVCPGGDPLKLHTHICSYITIPSIQSGMLQKFLDEDNYYGRCDQGDCYLLVSSK